MPNKRNNSITRTKIIPDKVFRKIWEAAQKNNKREFMDMFLMPSSKHYIDFEKKYGIDLLQAQELMTETFEKANLSFKEILSIINKRKIDIVNYYCIPVRTVEAWYDGTNRCPGYVRLEILRHFSAINLGKYILTEGEKEFRDRRPRVYSISNSAIQKHEKYADEIKRMSNEEDENEDVEFNEALNNVSKEKKDLEENRWDYLSMEELLDKTSYLANRAKR